MRKSKQPDLPHCKRLRESIQAQILGSIGSALDVPIVYTRTDADFHLTQRGFVEFIQIDDGLQSQHRLPRWGFYKVHDNLDNKNGLWLWIKRSDLVDTRPCLGWVDDVVLVSNHEWRSKELVDKGYIKVDKKLNKLGSGEICLWYKRGLDDHNYIEEIAASVRKGRVEDSYKEEALTQCGYTPVLPKGETIDTTSLDFVLWIKRYTGADEK